MLNAINTNATATENNRTGFQVINESAMLDYEVSMLAIDYIENGYEYAAAVAAAQSDFAMLAQIEAEQDYRDAIGLVH